MKNISRKHAVLVAKGVVTGLLFVPLLTVVPLVSRATHDSPGDAGDEPAAELYLKRPTSLEREFSIPERHAPSVTLEIETGVPTDEPAAEERTTSMRDEVEDDIVSVVKSGQVIIDPSVRMPHMTLGVASGEERDIMTVDRSVRYAVPAELAGAPIERVPPALADTGEADTEIEDVEVMIASTEINVAAEEGATVVVLDLATGLPETDVDEGVFAEEMERPDIKDLDPDVEGDISSELMSSLLFRADVEDLFAKLEGESGVERDISSEVKSAFLLRKRERDTAVRKEERSQVTALVEPSVLVVAGASQKETERTRKETVEETAGDVMALLSEDEGEVMGDIAIFPFDNMTFTRNVHREVQHMIRQYLEETGMSVVDDKSLRNFLIRERIRPKGYLSAETAGALRNRFGVKTILTGAIVSYSEEDNPKFGILARLIDATSGKIIWAEYASATGIDFTTILGLGRIHTIDDLIPEVMQDLFSSFITEAQQQGEETYRIVVMPFKNDTRWKKAGRMASYMSVVELFKAPGFDVVEYGNIRRSVINLRIRAKGELDYENMDALYETLGADLLLLGTVNDFSDGSDGDGLPQVGVTARLVDVFSKRIIWYDNHQLHGSDGVIVAGVGTVYSVDQVAYEVISELRERMESVLW